MSDIIEIFGSEEKFNNFQQMQLKLSTLKQQKLRIRYRKNIRYQLFRLRDHIIKGFAIDDKYIDNGVREWIENQLNANIQQNWETFTFTWDVSPTDPFKVIQKEEWNKHGGGWDEFGSRTPPGFTEQEA